MRRWLLLLGSCVFLIAILIQVPQVLHMIDSRSEGILVHLNSDEHAYLARVQESLSGRPEQAAEAIIGDPVIRGAQGAFLESAYGSLFGWTGWRAATVLQIMDSVVPAILFLAVWLFLFLCGFTRMQALGGALLFVFLSLYNLNRPIYQRASTLLTLLAMSGILLGLLKQRWTGIAGAVLGGLLVGTYFWSWTYAAVWCGLLFLWLLVRWWREGGENRYSLLLLVAFGVIALAFASPFLWEMWNASQHPLYGQAVFRSGMRPGHAPESLAYSMCFLLMLTGIGGAFLTKPKDMRPHAVVLITILTSVTVIHQQIVHGIIFNFVSHYLFLLMISAIAVLLLSLRLRPRWLILSLIGSVVYLAAVGYDGRHVIDQYRRDEGSFAEQHFSTLLPVLDALPRARILSDPHTSMFIAGNTHHDVVYSLYLKNVLLSNEELAQRFCLSLIELPPDEWNISEREHLLYPDAVGAFGQEVREQEVALVESTCRQISREAAQWVERFGVDYVLWDEKWQKQWAPTRLGVPMTSVAKNEGWSLWRVEN